jgi:hypothetical protein
MRCKHSESQRAPLENSQRCSVNVHGSQRCKIRSNPSHDHDARHAADAPQLEAPGIEQELSDLPQ